VTAFEPSTAYLNDWQFMDFIEGVTWEIPGDPDPQLVTGLKAQFKTIRKSDLQGSNVVYTNDTASVAVWQPEPTSGGIQTPFNPKPGHILRRVDRSNEGWVILDSTTDEIGRWNVTCEREVVNG